MDWCRVSKPNAFHHTWTEKSHNLKVLRRSCCEYALSVDKQAMIFNHIYIVRLISIELADVNRRGARRRFLQQPKWQQQNPYL